MTAGQEVLVPSDSQPMRLDVFLTQHADLSRTQLQKKIADGHVSVNGRSVKAHHRLHPGDRVTIAAPDVTVHQEAKVPAALRPEVVFEDNEYLVINKPGGLVVHGGPGIHEPTVYDWAIEHAPSVAQIGDEPEERGGIVHRLDRDVSGLMVIAKTQEAFDDLKHQFQDHTITKRYLALAHSRITDQMGRIDFAIARRRDKSGLMMARPGSTEGKKAETRFKVEKYVKDMTLLLVTTLTGRMHQIRVHFKAIGHPLVGDGLYKARQRHIKLPVPPRVFLHATHLEFDDLQGHRRVYDLPLAPDLQSYLARVS